MKKIISFFKRNSFKNLNTEIRGYGYEYSLKKFIVQLLAMLCGVVVAGYMYLLQPQYIFVVVIVAILVFPIIVRAQFVHLHNNKRFTNLVNYMEKMIIFFKQSPKIVNALEKTKSYCDQKTQEKIQEALQIINYEGEGDIYKDGLQKIEELYPSSRLLGLHRFIITVEKESSVHYRTSLNNVDYDLKEWINRVYGYQSKLKLKKNVVMFSLIANIGIVCLFSTMYSAMDQMTGIVSNPLYQIISTIFLVTMLILYSVLQGKISGAWLVDDIKFKNSKTMLSKIEFVENFNYLKILKKLSVVLILLVLVVLYGVISSNTNLVVASGGVLALCLYNPLLNLKTYKKSITKELEKEFPLWLRDIALNLNNYVVGLAIKNSVLEAATILQPFLKKLIKDIEEDPIGMNPYENFLGQFTTNEITEAMRSLYSLQAVSGEESEQEVSALIIRNQRMLENSEETKNQYALAGVGMIQFIPVLLVTVKILLDFALLGIGLFSSIKV